MDDTESNKPFLLPILGFLVLLFIAVVVFVPAVRDFLSMQLFDLVVSLSGGFQD